ncbi:hypothetical protein BDR06DRAFT_851899, partial [Suillus hirtellus]
YVSQGRAIRRMIVLYAPIEDLIAENDRRCEEINVASTVLPWLHEKLAGVDHKESEDMLRKLKRGADSAHGDDTGTLKDLVATWVNVEYSPTPLIRPGNKHHRGFVSDACGKLLCPAEWHWEDVLVKAGIRDRTTAFIVSENSWPSFMYENYVADTKNLERGLMKSKLLLMASNLVSVNSCLSTMMLILQIRFALSSITSWRTMDGDFDYQLFWNNIVDFFEDAPGPAAQLRMKELLEWWTRKVFGRNHRQDLTPDVVSKMSVSALAAQRQQME